MGNDQSSPKSSESGNQRNSRNVSAEVNRALERQRLMYEQTMTNLLKNQAAKENSESSPGQSGQSSVREPPPRPTVPPRNTFVENNLEKQRSPYNFNQNNLTGAVQQTAVGQPNSPQSLYPSLDNRNSFASPGTTWRNPATVAGNNNHTAWQNPAANNNDFVFVKSHFKNVTPSAPPAPSSSPSRQRSVSRPRSELGSENDKGINCPTCKKRFGEKIFNCQSGHASCLDCMLNHRNCGKCKLDITGIRNISVEEYVSQFKVPCVNADEGCKLNFKLGDMDSHAKECPFREVQCLLPGGMCLWKGKLSLLATHFENFHPSHKGDVDTEMSLQIHNICENKRMQLIKIGNFNFIFHLVVSESDNKIYIAVQLLGTKISAAKWTYEIHVYDKGEPRRKYLYSDICRSNAEPLNNLIKGSKCAVLPLPYAKTFINHGVINYRCFIKQEIAAKGETRRDTSNSRRGGRGRGRGGYHKFQK